MYVDFNKENLTHLEYINIVKNLLRKKSINLSENKYYYDEMIDYIVDGMKKRDLNFDSERGSLSTYRYVSFNSCLSTFFKNLSKRKDNVHMGDQQISSKTDTHMETIIDDNEEIRIYNKALEILNEKRKDDVRYQYFYEYAVLGRQQTDIAKDIGVTKTCVGYYISIVRKQLQNELINKNGADIWML